jgi:hypothetical protein
MGPACAGATKPSEIKTTNTATSLFMDLGYVDRTAAFNFQ